MVFLIFSKAVIILAKFVIILFGDFLEENMFLFIYFLSLLI